jgi:O-antigen/teichoic acid export membrane protein
MSNIRVTYSGLISFFVGLLIVITGLISTIIVTRSLTVEDFGTWRLVLGLMVFVMYIQPIISYWSTRETARGIKSAKTAIISNGIFSVVGIIIFLIIAFFASENSDADRDTILFAFILIPVMFFQSILVAINFGWKPYAVSYGMLTLEIGKIPLFLITLYWLEMGIYGIILSTFIAYLPSILVLTIFARGTIIHKFDIKYLKKWLKLFWIPTFPSMASVVHMLDIIVFTIITGSVIGLAYYGAALIISKLCANAIYISDAVYPKLLEGKQTDFIKNNMTLFSYFGIPLASVSIVFSKEILFVLNPIYQDAYLIIIFMTLRAFLFSYSSVFAKFLTGIEKVDTIENQTFKNFIKSKLFVIPSIRLVQYSIYIITLSIVLILTVSNSSEIDLITYWSIVWVALEIPFFIYFYIQMRKNFKFSFEKKNLMKYFLVSIVVFGSMSIISKQFLEFNEEILEFLPDLLMYIGAGIISYLIITYFVDNKTKQLVTIVIKEIRNKKIR